MYHLHNKLISCSIVYLVLGHKHPGQTPGNRNQKKCVWSKFSVRKEGHNFIYTVENQLEIEFVYGKERKF